MTACSTLGYQYYGIDTQFMKLRASDPKNDLDLLKVCAATEQDAAPCIAMLSPVARALFKEVLELRQRVKDCEKGNPPK